MTDYRYRILNVFALDAPLTGNPLCVFENGVGLRTETMQALALQFNLSETTFILPSATATARVRIFTPSFEMPFAGHPTLGTAQVVRSLLGGGDALTLEMTAGIIPVQGLNDEWRLQANPPRWRAPEVSRTELARMLGLALDDLGAQPLWVDAGAEQLVIPLNSWDAVRRAAPEAALLHRLGGDSAQGAGMAYVWAEGTAASTPAPIKARFFFPKQGALAEDPATGSACANLGGWFSASGQAMPVLREVFQGEEVGRPSRLTLRVDEQRRIFVSGRVTELGRGTISL